MNSLEKIKKVKIKLESGKLSITDIQDLIEDQGEDVCKYGYILMENINDCNLIPIIISKLEDSTFLEEKFRVLTKLIKQCKLESKAKSKIELAIHKELEKGVENNSLKMIFLEFLEEEKKILQNIDLREFFVNSNEELRRRIIEIAGKTGDIDIVKEALNDKDSIKIVAVNQLMKSNDDNEVNRIKSLFYNSSLNYKLDFINLLCKTPTSKYIDILKESLRREELKEATTLAFAELNDNEEVLEILLEETKKIIEIAKDDTKYKIGSIHFIINTIDALSKFNNGKITQIFEEFLNTPFSPCFHQIIEYFADNNSKISKNSIKILLRLCQENSSWITLVLKIFNNNYDNTLLRSLFALLYYYGPNEEPRSASIQINVINNLYELPRDDVLALIPSINIEELFSKSKNELEKLRISLNRINLSSFFNSS